ncbi:MAG: hypothetical protein KF838_14150 [Phycisphaeraceae bacterium]|nr:MAG: hypothetical protein KF838_14150 [Phycisphaeraceae bacterium]
MYIWSLDSVNVARELNGAVVEPFVDLARRTIKLAILLGEPIDLGEPHLVDNTFVLRELATSPAFAKVIRDHNGIRFFLAIGGKPATPRQILATRSANPAWASSAWRPHESQADRFRAWLAGGVDRTPADAFSDPNGSVAACEANSLLIEGLHRLDEIVAHKQADFSPRILTPQFGGSNPNLCTRIGEGIATLQQRIEIGDRLDDWATDDERSHCMESASRLTALLARLSAEPSGNSRTTWLNELSEIAASRLDAWTWTDEIARCVVNNAYNKVVAGSFRSDRVFAAESPLFTLVDELGSVDRVSPRTVDALHSLWDDTLRPSGGTTEAGEHPFLAVRDIDVLDEISWEHIEDAIESGAYRDAHAALRAAAPEERADRRLAFARTVAQRVSLNWSVVRDMAPGSAFLRDFERKGLEFFIDVASVVVQKTIDDESGFVSANADVIKSVAPSGLAYSYNRLARTANRRRSIGLQGRIERILRDTAPE